MKKYLIFASLAIGIVIGASALSALAANWTGPTATPPGNNIAAPINVGTSWQMKTGPLTINSNATAGLTSGSGLDVRGGGMFDNLGVWWTMNYWPNTANTPGFVSTTTTPVTGKVLTALNNDGGVGWVAPPQRSDIVCPSGQAITSIVNGIPNCGSTNPICAAGETSIPGGSTQSYVTSPTYCRCVMKTSPTSDAGGLDLSYGNGTCYGSYVDSQWGCDGNNCGLVSCQQRSSITAWTNGYGMRETRYTQGLKTCYKDWP